MDFNAIRERTLGSGRDEEAVTVNTRALIDKVLARYSGEWTVLRELLQNAADASATQVKIKFETLPSSTIPLPQNPSPSNLLRHTVQHHTLKRLIVSNNGQVFNENDWSRLKRIAEGNPDETKIGAFGVGFYSTFADCEEPFISSGNEAMAFFWKSNSLFTRRLRLPASESSPETNFVLDYRDTTSSVPVLSPLAQFLASSLTFVGIENIELWLDDWKLVSLSKKTSPSLEVSIPRDIESKTSDGLMKVNKVLKEVAQIDGQWMGIISWRAPQAVGSRLTERDNAPSLRKFFSRLAGSAIETDERAAQPQKELVSEDVAAMASASIFLNVHTASIRTYPGTNFSQELERATKKPPPKTTKLAILTAPYVENNLVSNAPGAASVFATVLPTRSGRIFIGFPTHQTTGLSAHISAPSVIPTVERESIDLNARYVKTWNVEMLRAAGIVCRIAWASEVAILKEKVQREAAGRRKIRPEDINPVLSEGITMAKNFSFRESTPSAQTGQIIEDAFWTCSNKASIDILSTCGVLPTHEVRIAPKDLSFMEGIPILPEKLVLEAKAFVDKLIDFGLITDITVTDISKALEANPLTSAQVGEFLNWLSNQSSRAKLDQSTIQNLLSVAVANDEAPDGKSSRILVFGTIKYFLNPSKIPTDLPVPSTVMPFKFTRSLNKKELEDLGWQELQIVPWVRWLLEEAGNRSVLSPSQDITIESSFSAQVLPILSKQWDGLGQSSKATLADLLSGKTIIPTKLGMKKPTDAYFPSVKLFDDLPVISGLSNVKDKFLLALGVRKTVELGVVFDRLLSVDGKTPKAGENNKSSHVELIQYLTSVREDIPPADIQRLKNTPIAPRETKPDSHPLSEKRYKISELFEPRPILRDLGLPVLSWPGLYRSGTPEGRFLSMLGLRTVPQVPELIDIMAKSVSKGDTTLREKAIAYFLSNHHTNGYSSFDYSKATTPFLPLENKPDKLSSPSECFVDEGAALLGFDILKRDLQPHSARFGVRTHPPMDQCISILSQTPPSTQKEARAVFSYFAGRLNEINSTNIPILGDLNFIPTFAKGSEKAGKPKYMSPRNCFLGDSDTFGEIFTYVDFSHEANAFLLKCGSKIEPTKIEVAQILVREPARISATFGNAEKYLALLRSLADSIATLRKNRELFRDMKRAPFLLATKELPSAPGLPGKRPVSRADEMDDLDEEDSQGIREWQLTSAEDAIIVDDYTNYNLFKTSILAAPQEESLEEFYLALGTPLLSSLVEEAARHGPLAADQKPAQKLQKQIYERSRLFLHDQPQETIKHDTKWLEKNLKVQLVSSISLRRSLKGRNVSNVEKRSAVVTQVNRDFTLWITGERPDLYQVSQALVHLLLTRPKLHSALTLEMLLKTDLLDLRARGFNVSRILRQKAAEARLAESRRQQELEEEQKRIEEQEKVWKASQEKAAKDQAPRQNLPGQFPNSPEEKGRGQNTFGSSEIDGEVIRQPQPQPQPRNLLSSISRQLGLGERGKQLQSFLGNSQQQPHGSITEETVDPPPPYSQGQQKSLDQQPVTAPHQLHENLLSAIRKTRPHHSSDIFSRGETNVVTESTSYCDEHPAHDLAFVAEIKHSMQMFLSPTVTANKSLFLTQNSVGLTLFADLLREVASIFSLDHRTINIFFEPNGKTIAFNRNGSIFCNFLYFQQLHEAAVKEARTNPVAGSDGVADALVYWWVILCHELAHNLVADHSSNHSYYTEGFVAQYFGRVVATLARGTNPPAVPQISAFRQNYVD